MAYSSIDKQEVMDGILSGLNNFDKDLKKILEQIVKDISHGVATRKLLPKLIELQEIKISKDEYLIIKEVFSKLSYQTDSLLGITEGVLDELIVHVYKTLSVMLLRIQQREDIEEIVKNSTGNIIVKKY